MKISNKLIIQTITNIHQRNKSTNLPEQDNYARIADQFLYATSKYHHRPVKHH